MSRIDLAPSIAGALEDRDVEDRTRVLRALLLRPLLGLPADRDLVRLARRHADWLRNWLERELGWRLTVDAQTVRLVTSYIPQGPTAIAVAERHAARARTADPAFTRRRYVLFCLALAVLEGADAQVALGRLAEEVVLLARHPDFESVEFTLATREERLDLVAAIRLLLRFGVLARVAGDEESYAAGGGDALYDIDRRVLATILATAHSPALVAPLLGAAPTIEQLEGALHEPGPAFTEDETNRRLRHAVSRRLLCDPVVYYDELPEAERTYLVGQRVALTRRLCEATGLIPELRAEGIALVDPDDYLTDLRMPEQGTDGHATLLVAEQLASAGPTDVATLRRFVKRLAKEHAAFWRRATREVGAEDAIVAEALGRLVGLGLVRIEGDGATALVHPQPALRRFAVTRATIRNGRSDGQR